MSSRQDVLIFLFIQEEQRDDLNPHHIRERRHDRVVQCIEVQDGHHGPAERGEGLIRVITFSEQKFGSRLFDLSRETHEQTRNGKGCCKQDPCQEVLHGACKQANQGQHKKVQHDHCQNLAKGKTPLLRGQ